MCYTEQHLSPFILPHLKKGFKMQHLQRGLLFSLLLLFLALGLAVPQAGAQQGAWFGSDRAVVTPLQPVNVAVVVPGYQGKATLVIFDQTKRSVGSWPVSLVGGQGNVVVIPRGTLGDHWAALFVNGKQVKDGTIYRLEAETTIQTGVEAYDQLYGRVRVFMAQDVLSYNLNGKVVKGYRSPDSNLLWLRDHYYQGRAFRYFEPEVRSALDAFRAAQLPDGSFPDFLARPDWGITAQRTPVEADVEYLYVLAVHEAWQMTGDDGWLQANLTAMQRALDYTMSNPLRWDPWLNLVKRPFTIDTWDFEYGPTTVDPSNGHRAPRHWIDDQTKWGIFHGDNTGLADALNALAHIEDYLNQSELAKKHRLQAQALIQRLNNLSWNGKFYRHHVKLVPWDVPGVDEETQLSLSNALALNRGVLTPDQAQTIINEYRSRLRRPGNVSFAEWWSIDPPFPSGSFGLAGRQGENPGEYVNGGIMPLVGGELARGAFRYGSEAYGFDIVQRYYQMVKNTNATFLWYNPTGGAGIASEDTLSTDGWGSSAMFGALLEGGAGVEDSGIKYSDVTLSPRWAVDPTINEAYVVARYAASDGYVAYRWQHFPDPKKRNRFYLNVEATGSGKAIKLRLFIPSTTKQVVSTIVNGQAVNASIEQIGLSRYLVVGMPADIAQVTVTLDERR